MSGAQKTAHEIAVERIRLRYARVFEDALDGPAEGGDLPAPPTAADLAHEIEIVEAEARAADGVAASRADLVTARAETAAARAALAAAEARAKAMR